MSFVLITQYQTADPPWCLPAKTTQASFVYNKGKEVHRQFQALCLISVYSSQMTFSLSLVECLSVHNIEAVIRQLVLPSVGLIYSGKEMGNSIY